MDNAGQILKSFTAAWDRFWFTPTQPATIALYRILFGLIVIQCAFFHLLPDLYTWYGHNGLFPASSISASWWHGKAVINVFDWFPESDQWLTAVFAIFCVSAVTLTIGFQTRLSSVLVAICIISLHQRCPVNINGGDAFMRLAAVWLMFSPAGRQYSVDNWIDKKLSPILRSQPQLCSAWAQRALQVQVAIIYAHTFFNKMQGPLWQKGTAVFYSVRMDDMMKVQIPFLYDNLFLTQIMTFGTLAVEGALWTLIWYRPWRYYVLLAGFALHLGIELSINLPMFEWLMMTSFVLFVDPPDVERFINWCGAKAKDASAICTRRRDTKPTPTANLAGEQP